MTKLTMRNTKAELLAAVQELQAQLTSVNAQLAQAAPAPAPAAKPQARPATDRGAVLSTMREYAVTHKCPTRLRDGVAQYYSYQVNAWLAI